MICPKCGRPVQENAVICRGCDFILDTDFLGDGILDEEHSFRPGTGGVDPAAFNLADAVILGNIDDDSQSFETSDSGFHVQQNQSARLYVSGRSQALMAPDAVPAMCQPLTDGVRLTPFEKHVLVFIDGKRPVEVIRRAAGLDESEVKTALATLADKGVVKVVGRALADFEPALDTPVRRAPQRGRMRGSELGAVAFVGDEADAAIEAAFRSSVALATPILGIASQQRADTGEVFQQTNVRENNEKRPRSEPTAATVRPNAMKGALNRGSRAAEQGNDSQDGIDASAEASADHESIVDKSGGCYDLPASSGTTAPTLATHSPAAVFSDLPDVEEVGSVLPSMQSLADSRVQMRPILSPPTPTLVRAGMASDAPSASAELLPSGEGEWQAAANGDVWDAPPAAVAPERAAQMATGTGVKHDADASDDESVEEATVAGQPMPALPLPKIASAGPRATPAAPPMMARPQPAAPPPATQQRQALGAANLRSPQARAGGKAAPVPATREASDSMDSAASSAIVALLDDVPRSADAEKQQHLDETTGLHDVLGPMSKRSAGAASAIFGAPAPITGAPKRDDSDQSTRSSLEPFAGERSAASALLPTSADSAQSIEVGSPKDGGHDDATMPPSQELSQSEGSERSSSSEMLDSALFIRPSMRPPAKALPLPATAQQAGTPRPQETSDEAARLPPGLASAARVDVGDSPTADCAPGGFADALSNEDSDSEATMNLDAEQQRRRLGQQLPAGAKATMMVRGAGGGAAPIPSGLSQAVDIAALAKTSNVKPSDENRKKAAKLFEDAIKEAAAGKLGAARMNAKLASIYDPQNESYRRRLEAWDLDARPPTQQAAALPTAAHALGSRPSDESQAEIKALYDEAQRFEDGGDIDAALDILEQGVERFPNAAAFYNRMGVILALRRRDYEAAVHAIQQAIDIDPDNLHYKSNLGKIVAKMRGARPSP